MMSLISVAGDICHATTPFIIQQCNCLTVKPHGLSESLAATFSYSNVYKSRRQLNNRNLAIVEDRDTPGTCGIMFDPSGIHPAIVCIFGQWRPGRIGTPYFNSYPESTPPETSEMRLI